MASDNDNDSDTNKASRPRRRILVRPDRDEQPAAEPEASQPSPTAPAKKPTPSLAEALAPYADLLGEVPDSEIAAMAGIHRPELVTQFREALQGALPANSSPQPEMPQQVDKAPTPPRPQARPSPVMALIAEAHDLVGKEPDNVIAERLGCSVGSVRNYRKAHGIPGAPRSTWGMRRGAGGTARAPTSPAETHGAHKPTLADTVLLAATVWPGTWTTSSLADELGVELAEVEAAASELHCEGLVEGSTGAAGGSASKLRASAQGEVVCGKVLRREILGR